MLLSHLKTLTNIAQSHTYALPTKNLQLHQCTITGIRNELPLFAHKCEPLLAQHANISILS